MCRLGGSGSRTSCAGWAKDPPTSSSWQKASYGKAPGVLSYTSTITYGIVSSAVSPSFLTHKQTSPNWHIVCSYGKRELERLSRRPTVEKGKDENGHGHQRNPATPHGPRA